MKYYRPGPFKLEGNYFLEILTKHLQENGWKPLNFEFWNLTELIKNRKKCSIIHLHWPESFWRSNYKLIGYLKALRFIFIFILSKILGYKWVFSAHNVIPHYKVKSEYLERLMRKFILCNFNLVVGHARNTKNDLKLAFGTSGRKFVLALHGTYENYYPIRQTKEEFRKENNIPLSSKIILTFNSNGRENKGVDEIFNAWIKIQNDKDILLLVVGKQPYNYEELQKYSNFRFIEGRVEDNNMGGLFNAVDFLFLNYQTITTSGMFFLSLTLQLPIIAPNLPFFKLHSTCKTTIFFDYNYSLLEQIDDITKKIILFKKPTNIEYDKIATQYSSYNCGRVLSDCFENILNDKKKGVG